MNDKEIDEAIENNPGASDLEIALAIESDEATVGRRRKALSIKFEKAAELKKLESENAAKAAALAKEKEEARIKESQLAAEKRQAEEAKVRAINKQDPGHTKPIPAGAEPSQKKIYLRLPDGSALELKTVHEGQNSIILEFANPQADATDTADS